MNEATGICDGECPDGKKPQVFEKNPVEDEKFFYEAPKVVSDFRNDTWFSGWTNQTELSTFKLPFIPGSKNLDTISLSLNATHPSNGLSEIDVHNLFGHLEGKITREFFLNKTVSPADLQDKRTFVMSRSTFAGSGAHV